MPECHVWRRQDRQPCTHPLCTGADVGHVGWRDGQRDRHPAGNGSGLCEYECERFPLQPHWHGSGQPTCGENISTSYARYLGKKTSIQLYFLFFFNILHIFSCDQAALQMVFSVCLSVCPSVRLSVCPSVHLSVCPSHLFDYVPIIVSSYNFQELLPMTNVRSMQKVKVRGQRSRSQRSQPNLTVSGL